MKSKELIQEHRKLCNVCAARAHDPCARCVHGHWGPQSDCVPSVGLGDVVAVIAQPVAKAIDFMYGTTLADCGGCAQRKEVLNQIKV